MLQKFDLLPISGLLLGISIRTRKPISLNLAPLFWKLLLGRDLSHADLEDVDLNYARSVRAMAELVRSDGDGGSAASSISSPVAAASAGVDYFEGISFVGRHVELFPGSRSIALTEQNR